VRTNQVFGDEDCALREGARTPRSTAIDRTNEYLRKIFMSFLHDQGVDQLIWQKTHSGFSIETRKKEKHTISPQLATYLPSRKGP
jgi:hypothetical protein